MAKKTKSEVAQDEANKLMADMAEHQEAKRELDEQIKAAKERLEELHKEHREEWGDSIRLDNGKLAYQNETKVEYAKNFNDQLLRDSYPSLVETKVKPGPLKAFWENPKDQAALRQIGVVLKEGEKHNVETNRK